MFATPLLVLLLGFDSCVGTGSFNLGTCSMSCEGEVGGHFTGLHPNPAIVGSPGKKGPQGEKGQKGARGVGGEKGDAAIPCVCPDWQALIDKVSDLEEELRRTHTPHNCSEVVVRRANGGVFTIYPDEGLGLEVYCDLVTDGGGWIVFQRRMDGSENFFRGWDDYVKGFGHLNGEFWLGLDAIYKLMQIGTYELRVDMEDFDGQARYAKYTTFSVGSPEEYFAANISGYSGDAGNSFSIGNKMFSTKDQDHDTWPNNCAQSFKGGWWYGACHGANLNGLYLKGNHDSYADGVNWHGFRGYHYSLKFTEMKIRKLQ